MKHNNLKRCAMLVLTALFGILQMSAYHLPDDWKYTTVLSVDPTGSGTVYMTYNENVQAQNSNNNTYTATVRSRNNTASVTLSATATDGYRFLNWTDANNNIINASSSLATITLTHNNRRNDIESTSGFLLWRDIYKNQTFSYIAHFVENGSVIAKVQDGQEQVGSAVIVEEDFDVGDEIHLVASTFISSEMDGWSFDHWELNGATVSNSSEITVTVPDEVVTYVAVFSHADTENYCFLRNKSTGRYLKLVETTPYSTNGSSTNPKAYLNGSFIMLDEVAAVSDPGCVFIVSGTREGYSLKNAWIKTQNITVGHFNNAAVIKKSLNIRAMHEGTYSISFEHTERDATMDLYFRDPNSTDKKADLSLTNDATTEWEIRVLNRANLDKWAFGAGPNSLVKRGDKYYTTLYTTFPYEVQSGKAYYINHQSIMQFGEGEDASYKVKCFEFTDGKVPAMTPVIIECDSDDPFVNKLLPLPMNSEIPAVEDNLMQGQIKLLNGEKAGDGDIYVLSIGKNTGVGFYKLKTGINIPDNKAYANLTLEAQNALSRVTYIFEGEDEGQPTNILETVNLPEDLTGLPIYDLQGRRVSNPQHGVYIVNGKKFVIK